MNFRLTAVLFLGVLLLVAALFVTAVTDGDSDAVADGVVVPVERVRLRTEVVTEQEQVSGTVQREQVVVDQESALHRG